MRRPTLHQRSAGLSPVLNQLVRTLAREAKRDRESTRKGDAKALAAFGRLVTLTMASQGVLRPTDDLREDIDRIARKYLRRKKADQDFRVVLDRVHSVEKRDAIDIAHIQLLDLSERAHYYAGLASGVMFMERNGL